MFRLLRNHRVRCRVHNSPILVRILNLINPVSTLWHHLLKINFNIILPTILRLPNRIVSTLHVVQVHCYALSHFYHKSYIDLTI